MLIQFLQILRTQNRAGVDPGFPKGGANLLVGQ